MAGAVLVGVLRRGALTILSPPAIKIGAVVETGAVKLAHQPKSNEQNEPVVWQSGITVRARQFD